MYYYDFLKNLTRKIKKETEREFKNKNQRLYPFVRFGTVIDVTGGPQVQFDGEDAGDVTARRYPYLSSYTPTIGDRVMLVKGGNTWIIQGKVIS